MRFIQSTELPVNALNNLALLGFCVAVGGHLALACLQTGIGDDLERHELPNQFAHSVIPIIIGYIARTT